jgi:hypothetical protein
VEGDLDGLLTEIMDLDNLVTWFTVLDVLMIEITHLDSLLSKVRFLDSEIKDLQIRFSVVLVGAFEIETVRVLVVQLTEFSLLYRTAKLCRTQNLYCRHMNTVRLRLFYFHNVMQGGTVSALIPITLPPQSVSESIEWKINSYFYIKNVINYT